jgi:hypothetical protein
MESTMTRTMTSLVALVAGFGSIPAASAATFTIPVTSASLTFDNGAGVVCATNPCSFTDTFTFSGLAGFNVVGATITSGPSDAVAALYDIALTSVTLNGSPFTITSTGIVEQGFLSGVSLLASGNTLVVSGTSYGGGTYSGTLQLRQSAAAVPEPAAWALMIAGFATVGYAMRRRPTHRFAQAV